MKNVGHYPDSFRHRAGHAERRRAHKGRTVVYCSATNEMCEAETKSLRRKYDVKTSFIRNGSGSTLAKVDAEEKPAGGRLVRRHARSAIGPVKWGCCSRTHRRTNR